MKLNTLYKKSVKGAIQSWKIMVEGGAFYTESGQLDGKITLSKPTYTEAKNIGKANETTAEEQAIVEAEAKWNKKLKEGYVENIEDINNKTFIKPILAYPISKRPDSCPIEYPVICQIKKNGTRCVITKDGAFSRKGEQYFNIKHIIKSLEGFFEKNPNVVLDGELEDPTDQKNLNRLIKLVAVTRKEKDLTDELISDSENIVRFCLYDGYVVGKESMGYVDRFEEICNKLSEFDNKYINIINMIYVDNVEGVYEYAKTLIDQGFEGAILRIPNMPYVHKRSMDLLKIKRGEDAEFEIVDILEGKGDWAGCAKKIVCKLDENRTFISNVRGTMDFLREVIIDKQKYIGKFITVGFQDYSEYGVPLIPYTNLVYRDYE